VALVFACACGLLAACGAGGSATTVTSGAGASDPTSTAAPDQPQGYSLRSASSSTTTTTQAPEPFRFFSPSSFWNTPVPASAPLAHNSGELIEAFDAEVAAEQQTGVGPWIDTASYSVPIYTVPATQPPVHVTLTSPVRAAALQRAFDAVPIPPNARPATGTDSVLVIWQPSSDRLWEFWRISLGPGGWRAAWGGAMQHVSSNPGVYGPRAWPGAKSYWGSSASSMSIAGGLITLEDLQYGRINHALSLAVPDVRAGVYASPAQRDDGRSRSPLALPEGTHLRLNPKLDIAALHLPPLTAMVAEAAQRYGIYIRDHARNITFYAQDPTPTATNPYTGPTGYFEGSQPSHLLALFPWNELQVIKPRLHRNTLKHGLRLQRQRGLAAPATQRGA
jgi:hypothetical protein